MATVALGYNGTSQYATRGAVLSTVTTNLTLMGWFNLASNSLHGQLIFNGNGPVGNGWGIGVGANGDQNTNGNYLVIHLGGVAFLAMGTQIGTGWHHLAITRGATTWKAYIDGVQTASTSTTSPFTPATNFSVAAVHDGSRNVACQSAFVGLWENEYSAASIKTQMNSTTAVSLTNIKAFYGFQENTGTAIADTTGTDATGLTATGSPSWVTPGPLNATKVTDSSAISDTPTINKLSYINVSDSSAVSDTPTLSKLNYISVSDSSAVSDTITLQVPAVCVLSGTIVPHVNEQDIDNGGKTIILTLTGDTWIAAGAGSFDLQRQNIINGLTSAGSETFGWNNIVKVTQSVAGVVRTSNTIVTITLDAEPLYSITADETITATIPSTALTGGVAIVATPTFTVSVDYKISKTDSTAVGEAITLSLTSYIAPGVVGGGPQESLVVSDTVTLYITSWFFSVSDSTAIGELITLSLTSNVNVIDSSTVSDTVSITILLLGPVNVSDSSVVSDTPTVYITTRFLSVSESTTVTETVLFAGQDQMSIIDSTTVSETATLYITTLFLSVSDSTTVSDAIAFTGQTLLSVSDSTVVTDTITMNQSVLSKGYSFVVFID